MVLVLLLKQDLALHRPLVDPGVVLQPGSAPSSVFLPWLGQY